MDKTQESIASQASVSSINNSTRTALSAAATNNDNSAKNNSNNTMKNVSDEQPSTTASEHGPNKPKSKPTSERLIEAVRLAAARMARNGQVPRRIPSEEELSKDIEYPLEWYKTILCFFALIFALILNHMALATAHDVISRNALPDLFFTLIQQIDGALDVGDWLCCLATFLSVSFITILHKHRSVILRRMAYNIALLFVLRSMCICVTHIPSSYQNNERKCMLPKQNTDTSTILFRMMKLFYRFGLQTENSKGQVYCGDQLFSGHTIIVSMTTFYMNHYTPHSVWPLRWLLIITCIVGMACLSLSRAHYTVDVMISYWLSSLIFSFYHAFVSTPHSSRLRARAYRRIIIYWTMFVLEVNVPSGRLRNQLEWPFSSPVCIKDFIQNWSDRNRATKAGRIADFIDAHRLNTHL